MSYQPVSGIVPQYSTDDNELASGYYLKFYIANTTTPLSMATDSTGGTLLVKAKLNPDGLPISNPLDNDTVFIPHVNQDYRLVIYRNEADADANNTAGAFLNVPSVKPMASGSLSGGTLPYVYDSVAEMVAASELSVGSYVRTSGYTTSGDGGSNDYEIVAGGTGTADGGSFIDLDNGLQAKGLFGGSVNIKQFGAVGDGVTDDRSSIQSAFDFSDSIFIPAGTFRCSDSITKIGQIWQIEGAGPQLTTLQFDVTANNNLSFSNGGTSITRVSLKNFAVITAAGDKSAGASINFADKIINSVVSDIYIRHFWHAFQFVGVTKCFFTNITYDQFTRDVGSRGGNGFNCLVSQGRMVDWHLQNIQGSGFVSGASPESSIDNHFKINGCDGIYIENSHFFYSDRVIRFTPTNTGEGVTVSSVLIENCYFDTTEINHVLFENQASTAYQSIQFNNCLFRAAQTNHSVQFSQTGKVEHVKFSNCIWRDNFKSGIQSSLSNPNNVDYLTVSGCSFDNNNQENVSIQGDIITRGSYGVFSGNSFSLGGVNGHAIRFLSTSSGNLVVGCDFTQSTAVDTLNDAGSGTRLYSLQGFVIDNKGGASITNPNTSVTVSHGLNVTPSLFDIRVTPTTNLTSDGVSSFWINNVTATTFDINLDTAPTANVQFGWNVMANT